VRLLALAAFAAGAALLAALIWRAGLSPLASALSTLGVAGLALICLAHLPVLGLLGAAWRAISRVSLGNALLRFAWARAVRDAAAEALPLSQLGGYVLGARALALAGVDAASAGVSTFYDLLFEFAAKVPYVLLGFALLEFARGSDVAALGFGAAAIFSLALFLAPRAGWASRKAMPALIAFARRIPRSRPAIGSLIRGRILRGEARSSILIHLGCWILGAGETWLIFRLMNLSVRVTDALVVDSLVGAIRAASFFVPAAIGVQEGGYVLICGLFAISPASALAVSLARRARDLVIAAPMLVSWQWKEARGMSRRAAGAR
jgi:putative membrane protein